MTDLSRTLKTTALAGLFGLGIVAATAAPAQAERSYTRCDRDRDTCWRVLCDNDGDDCRRVVIHTGYDSDRHYRYRYNRDYHDRNYRSYRHWVCDRDGDDCHWSYNRW